MASHASIAAQEDAKAAVDGAAFLANLSRVNSYIAVRSCELATLPTTSTPALIEAALGALPLEIPTTGLGITHTSSLLLDSLCPALSTGHAGPRFFGLVTGGVNPAALLADQLVTSLDQNVQLHLPGETISTTIEHITLQMLLSLLRLPLDRFTSNSFTTGATASNVLALSIGREHTIANVQRHHGIKDWSVADDGFGGVEVDVFCAGAHSSVAKAASLVGIGRRNVFDLAIEDEGSRPCAFDLNVLERRLAANVGKRGSIVVSSFGEVNTGGFTPDTRSLRMLCDLRGAWLHIDAAFGAFAVLHRDFAFLSEQMSLADSITSDAHKWLNVPYDCGIFFSRSPDLVHSVLGPGSVVPTYLSTASDASTPSTPSLIDPYRSISSPLFNNIENSRRFRALPVYASLVSLGRQGLSEMVVRNISFARTVESFMRSSPFYSILTPSRSTPQGYQVLNIVLFAPSDGAPARFQGPEGAAVLCRAINESRECYVTGTTWRGRGAIRLAVSNWDTREARDWEIVRRVLERVMLE